MGIISKLMSSCFDYIFVSNDLTFTLAGNPIDSANT